MIKGIGTDIVEISRIEKAIAKNYFKERVFTLEEIKIAQSAEYYAGRWAGKESLLKALGMGLLGTNLREIEILKKDSGEPYLVLHGKLAEIAESRGITNIYISISHSKENALAFVVLEG